MRSLKKELIEQFFSAKEMIIIFFISSVGLYPLMKGINTDAIPEIHFVHVIWYVGILCVIWVLLLLHIGLHVAKNMWLVKNI